MPLTSDIKRLDEVRRDVGMVFQQFNLFPHLTVMENLHACADLGAQDAEEAGRGDRACTISSACESPNRRTNIPGNCPAVSSSASRSPARFA